MGWTWCTAAEGCGAPKILKKIAFIALLIFLGAPSQGTINWTKINEGSDEEDGSNDEQSKPNTA
jgi:hypothetical protein